jgi:hypothetical protein
MPSKVLKLALVLNLLVSIRFYLNKKSLSLLFDFYMRLSAPFGLTKKDDCLWAILFNWNLFSSALLTGLSAMLLCSYCTLL